MSRSLSLAAYLAYARRDNGPSVATNRPRPEGELLWAHAVTVDHADAILLLARRLELLRPETSVLLTTSTDVRPTQSASAVIHEYLPEDSIPAAESFLGYWKPDLCLWTGGGLQPAFLTYAYNVNMPLFLVDPREDLLIRPGWRWFPDLPRALIQRFKLILASSDDAARFVRRMGAKRETISIAGPFQEGALALDYSETAREELAELLRGRQIWLAAMVQPDEVATILDAHRQASRIAHRALLVIVPNDVDHSDDIGTELAQNDWRFIRWSEGGLPEETTQIILADTQDEMGLWYRLCPLTFMGSSLGSGYEGCDPNEPAAHGSAILYGPNVGRYLNSYSRYAEAGAARIVNNSETLSAAVSRLFRPDEAALMATAAWDVASEAASVTDKVLDLVQDTLDQLEARP